MPIPNTKAKPKDPQPRSNPAPIQTPSVSFSQKKRPVVDESEWEEGYIRKALCKRRGAFCVRKLVWHDEQGIAHAEYELITVDGWVRVCILNNEQDAMALGMFLWDEYMFKFRVSSKDELIESLGDMFIPIGQWCKACEKAGVWIDPTF